jgi:hypothetical protein
MAGMIRVYLLPEALEIDEITFVEIERTRVYFDDVLAVTYHRAVSLTFAILMGLVGGILGAIGVVLIAQKEWPGAITLLIVAAPFLITFVVHVILKTDFVTVFGRRTLARMRFRVRKGRAREVYQELADKIRVAQAAAAASQPKPPPPEAPELPPGPPLAASPS